MSSSHSSASCTSPALAHRAPLPGGVPYDQQQLRALSADRGVLEVDDDSQLALAQTIKSHL